jgi:hypothetical protein
LFKLDVELLEARARFPFLLIALGPDHQLLVAIDDPIPGMPTTRLM